MATRRLGVVIAITAVGLACAAAAQAHQIAVNNGVSVTVHVAPDDEPIVGQTAVILVPKVKPRIGKFAWATCRCTLKVSNANGDVLLSGKALPRTEFVFPEAGAYRIDFAGRVKRIVKQRIRWVPFKVWFAIRASDAPS